MEQVLLDPNRINSRETVVPEVGKCHKRLMDLPNTRGENISGVLPFFTDEAGREYGASILEQGFAGSDSFIVSVYEFVEPHPIKNNSFKALLVDGREANLHLANLVFANECDYDNLHELCGMIDSAIDKYYENDLLCNR